MSTHRDVMAGQGGDITRSYQPAPWREGASELLADELGELAARTRELALTPAARFTVEQQEARLFSRMIEDIASTKAALDALEARAIVALDEASRRDQRDASRDRAAHEHAGEPTERQVAAQALRWTTEDVSLATRRSSTSASRTITSARRMVHDAPHLLDSLATAAVSPRQAEVVTRGLRDVSPEAARQVDQLLHERLPSLDGAGERRLRDEVQRLVQHVDEQGAQARHHRARRRRHVAIRPGLDGMATLTAHLSALDAAAVNKRLELEAERRRAGGDDRGHQALKADALADTLIGRADGMDPVTLDIGVVITDRQLLRRTEGGSAQVEGYGATSLESLRPQLRAALTPPGPGEEDLFGADGEAVRAELRRLYTHPTTGELVAVQSRAREFPSALKAFLTLRDTTCRGPFCDAPIRQADHIEPHAAGGPTSLANGQGLCAHHNQKEELFTQVSALPPASEPGHDGGEGAPADENPGRPDPHRQSPRQQTPPRRTIDSAPITPGADRSSRGHAVAWTSRTGITRITTATALTPARPSPRRPRRPWVPDGYTVIRVPWPARRVVAAEGWHRRSSPGRPGNGRTDDGSGTGDGRGTDDRGTGDDRATGGGSGDPP